MQQPEEQQQQQQQQQPEKEEEIDEELEDEELIDEDYEESGERKIRVGSGPTGRTVTLQMLLASGMLEPGEGAMAIEYLGQRFIGDLLPDGKIKSQETDIVFASPSAWAINCKRIINPEKKSGCGWASIKYRGKKLDIIKNAFFKKKKEDQDKDNEVAEDEEMEKDKLAPPTPPVPVQRIVVKHGVIGTRAPHHDPNTLVECTPFSTLGKIQPFLVSMSTNAVLVMDFHCHLTTSEVVGYLAGHWDVNAHNLAITHAFPCRCRLGDKELAPLVEADVYRNIEQRHLTLVGWYHSHPTTCATPTLRDIDAQLDYEIRMKGNSDASYTPCVGVICSPYNKDITSLESSIISYWVTPPPETKPHEYGKPMLMSYTVVQDQYLSQEALNEMKRCVDFYKNEKDYVNFTDKYKGATTYIDKLKATLTSKFPRDHSDGILWSFIQELVCPSVSESKGDTETCETIVAKPAIATPERVSLLVPTLPIPATIKSMSSSTSTSASNTPSMVSAAMIGTDLASALFGSKFPTPTSLMGLSIDPGRSVLGGGSLTVGSMFIPPMGFKLDNISILKPVGTSSSSTISSTLKSSTVSLPAEIISSMKSSTATLPAEIISSMKFPHTDSKHFLTPSSIDKACTVTSGQMN